jgi:hypothetical protein
MAPDCMAMRRDAHFPDPHESKLDALIGVGMTSEQAWCRRPGPSRAAGYAARLDTDRSPSGPRARWCIVMQAAYALMHADDDQR